MSISKDNFYLDIEQIRRIAATQILTGRRGTLIGMYNGRLFDYKLILLRTLPARDVPPSILLQVFFPKNNHHVL